ncbi:MAG: adenylate kinase [Paludibacteraceae bacterium]|nr:adenylate kinase [Paludibacteraceae bacterium]
MFNIVIFGAPGSGKGTQSDFLVKKYNLVHLSTGDLLRAEIAAKSELGKIAEGLIAKGEFVPDNLIIDLLAGTIDKYPSANGFIFDGFPRTVVQAGALDKMLSERSMQVNIMLNIAVDNDELVARLLNRGKTSGRSDDNLETIQQRLKTYEEKTMPVIDFYDKQGKNNPIAGMGTMEDVFDRICQAIDKVNA